MFRFLAPGHVRSAILLQNQAENKLLTDTATALLQFLATSSTAALATLEDRAFLEACCELHYNLNRHASQCKYLIDLRSGAGEPWLLAAMSAAERFIESLNEVAEKTLLGLVEGKGFKEAAALLQLHSSDVTLPPHLERCHAVLIQAELLQKLGSEEPLSAKGMEADAELFYSKLASKTKKLVTVWSLEIDLMKKFVPAAVEASQTFSTVVMSEIRKVLTKNDSICERVSELLVKYRTGYLKCCGCDH